MFKGLKKILPPILGLLLCIPMASSAWVITKNEATASGVIEKDNNSKPTAYIIGKPTIYSSIEKALEIANTGDIVTLIQPTKPSYDDTCLNPDAEPKDREYKNLTSPDSVEYTITRDCEIKSGVTLMIPIGKNETQSVVDQTTFNDFINFQKNGARGRGDASYGGYAKNSPTHFLRCTVNVADNVTITNNGTLLVSGLCSSGNNAPGSVGQTSHDYSRLLMGANSQIIQNNPNAKTYCYGYIDEKSENNGSTFELANGTLNIPFIVNDYKGFPTSFAMTDGAITQQRCTPFNQFSFPNISTITKISYVSKVIGDSSIWAKYNNPNVDKVFPQSVNLVGNDNTCVFETTDPTYSKIIYKYNAKSGIAKVNFYGGLKLNSFSLKVKESIISIDLNTKESYFPISYRFDIELFAGQGQPQAVFDNTKQRLKLLPGSKFKINENVLLKESELVIYSSFHDGSRFIEKRDSFVGGIAYPLKPGAICILNGGHIETNVIAGTIYGSAANIQSQTNNVTAKEVWSLKSSGGLNPPWTIYNYLEIREELQVLTLDDVSKPKFFVGTNIFTTTENFIPKFEIILNDGKTLTVNEKQKVFVLDQEPISYRINPLSNISKFFKNGTYYNKNEVVKYSQANAIVGSINTSYSVSSDFNGVNEFDVQTINIECMTEPVSGQIPLWPGSKVNLRANIQDPIKAYDKKITWKTSDPNIADVDQNGVVTGVNLGQVTITAMCDGLSATITLDVIEEIAVENVTEIFITDNNGNSSKTVIGTSGKVEYHGKYGNKQNITFTANIVPAGAPYQSIVWDYTGTGDDRNYMGNYEKQIVGQESVVVHTIGGTGKSDDICRLKCTVEGLDGVLHTATFVINHQASVCFTEGTRIILGDGTFKNIEDITLHDRVMAFNHLTGEYESTPLLAVVNHGVITDNTINMSFENGSKLSFFGNHELFDCTLNKYVDVSKDSVNSYINHIFASFNPKTRLLETTKLISANIKEKSLRAYTLVSNIHMNIVAENMLTFTPNLTGLNNYFEYDDNLKWNKESMEKDIKTYGLYTYDDWKDKVPYFMFEGYNFKYFKVSIGKGLMTYEDVLGYIAYSKQLIDNGEMKYPY